MGLIEQARAENDGKVGQGSKHQYPGNNAHQDNRPRLSGMRAVKFAARSQFSTVHGFKPLALVPPGTLAINE